MAHSALRARGSRLRNLSIAFLKEGVYVVDRFRIKSESTKSASPATIVGQASMDWMSKLHEILDAPQDCNQCATFRREIWPIIVGRIADHTPAGGSAHDGDPNLALAVWAVAFHAKPATVVETGVARGITSAAILFAMHETHNGHLYSIDLPPLSSGWAEQSGAAVPNDLRSRWTYIRGSARRRLPELVRRLGSVDLFVHDSLHTYGHMEFEFRTVWPNVTAGGIVIADDIQDNAAFEELVFANVRSGRVGRWLVAPEGSKLTTYWGLATKADSRAG
jgi:methyltransferase family protein